MKRLHIIQVKLFIMGLMTMIWTMPAQANSWEPKGILAVWAQGRGDAHINFLRNQYDIKVPAQSNNTAGKPQGILVVWAQGRGIKHNVFLQQQYEKSQPASSGVSAGVPKGILTVWAQGRGQAHLDFLQGK
jgi:hypothetical protein